MTPRPSSLPAAALSRRRTGAAIAAALMLLAAHAVAAVELPRRSPRARVSQQVGLTEIAVDYYSPAVRGRRIWGAAVPYGQVWRSEENPGWRVTFSRPVVFGDQPIPAGVYSLLAVPAAGDPWTLAVNRDANLIDGGDRYDAALDVARVKVRATPAPARERLAFQFSDFTDEQTSLDLEWEKVRLSVPIRLHTREQILESIAALDQTWRAYADLARYMIETKKDDQSGLVYIDKSIALDENATNTRIKAALLARLTSSPDGRRPRGRTQESPSRAPLPAGRGPSSETEALPMAAGRRAFDGEDSMLVNSEVKVGVASSTLPGGSPVLAGPVIAVGDERRAPAHGTEGARFTPERQRPAEVASVVRHGASDVQSCYQRALVRDPGLTRGKLTVSVTVGGASGLARTIDVRAAERLRALEPCLRDVLSRWTFPLAPADYVTEFPIVLRGKD